MQNNFDKNPTDKDKMTVGFITIVLGLLLFFLGVNSAKENQTGAFKFVSGMLLFSCGICTLGDIGKKADPKTAVKSKDYSKDLVDELESHLQLDEKIVEYVTFIEVKASSLISDQYFGLAATTNKRIIIYQPKIGGHKMKSLKFNKVSSVEYEEGIMFDSLEFSTSGEKLSIEKISKGNTSKFVSYINSMI